MNYYNDNDSFICAWLRALISAGIIGEGVVDERSIADVEPKDLAGFTQCHFFAGVGGWAHALRLANWTDDRPVWTGSCPCQPFSQAGKGLGEADERHLWPFFRNLIGECRPATVFGEQVAGTAGRIWLAGVRSNLEALAYGVGASDLCAAGISAPHVRQRLFWVADSNCARRSRTRSPQPEERNGDTLLAGPGQNGRLGDPGWECNESRRGVGDMGCSTGEEQSKASQRKRRGNAVADSGSDSGLADMHSPGFQISQTHGEHSNKTSSAFACGGSGHWGDFQLIPCRDGKSRRIESGTFPLAHGIPNRVGLLRGYGNAIVPQLAAEFIQAFKET